jgi:23S rRNA (cytosine1962-C5)-methyltransferase
MAQAEVADDYMNEVTVTKRGADRIRHGHLWIYRSDVNKANDAAGGSIVFVRDQNRNFVGQAFYSNSSQIALRFLSQTEAPIDREWWRRRIIEAAGRRAGLATARGQREKSNAETRSAILHEASVTNAYRLIYSEGDLLPSVICDRYDDVLVLQTLSQGSDAIKPVLAELLAEEFKPRAIIERNDVRVRQHEGLEMIAGTLYGEAAAEFEIVQEGIRFLVAPLSGQKTGSFLDQRENRVAARSVAHGRALDCFTFNGAFALHLAGVCESVVAIDISAEAIESARRNATLNNVNNVEFREANVFDALRELEAEGERFDTIVLDPPAFAKNRASAKGAARGYKEINLRAIKLLNPGGILITCTCSYHMPEDLFLGIISEAANDARRKLQLIEKRTQASDHPILLSVPETYYLKCVIARVLD